MGPYVSIIMPAYNSGRFIEKAINSVLNQSYNNFELLIIDDGSEDNTADIVNTIAKKDLRIHYIRNEKNLGVSAARNRGILLASGDWIAFLDSDDKWASDKLEKQINLINENKLVKFLFTGSSFVDERDNPYSYVFRVPEKVSYQDLLKQNVISCSSVLVNKQCISGLKMERDDLHEDFAMWMQILKKETYAYGINQPLLIYRLSGNSKSGNKVKSAKMTFKVYRYLGLNLFQSVYFMFFYLYRNAKKYRRISLGV